MSGEKNLGALLSTLTVKLEPEVYVFVALGDRPIPPGLHPRMIFREDEALDILSEIAKNAAHKP